MAKTDLQPVSIVQSCCKCSSSSVVSEVAVKAPADDDDCLSQIRSVRPVKAEKVCCC